MKKKEDQAKILKFPKSISNLEKQSVAVGSNNEKIEQVATI